MTSSRSRIVPSQQRQESTGDRQRRGLLACCVCLKARGHHAIIRVRGGEIDVRIPRASLAFAADDGAHPVCVRLGARNGGRALIRRPDTRSDGPQVSLAAVPATAKRQGQHDRCRDHHPPPVFHAPSRALPERRPLNLTPHQPPLGRSRAHVSDEASCCEPGNHTQATRSRDPGPATRSGSSRTARPATIHPMPFDLLLRGGRLVDGCA